MPLDYILTSAFGSSNADKFAIVNIFKSLENICLSKVKKIFSLTKK